MQGAPERSGVLSVALDATPLLGLRTGVGAFCRGALGALVRRADLDVRAFAVSWRRRHELGPRLPPGVDARQRAMPARPLQMCWSRLGVPPAEWFVGSVDVVHGTNYVVPPTRRAARVVTVHDLTALRYPELCDAPSLRFPRLVRRAATEGAWVHVPSRFVAEEVVAELGIDPARVRAVYHGVPEREAREVEECHAHEGAPRASSVAEADPPGRIARLLPAGTSRYVLAVGTIEPRKDYPTLIRAFDELAGDLAEVTLVIAGARAWGSAQFDAALAAVVHRERILALGWVDDRALGELLLGACVVAYPSLYEGFGFVPLEAMAARVPVVATSAGAVPEVAGDGALLVPPGDTGAMAGALQLLLTDEGERAALVERGARRARSFNWDLCAAGLSDLYHEASL